jgi:two-component system sensor histidine kinase BaeS
MIRPIFSRLLERFVVLLLGVIVIVGISFFVGATTSLDRWSSRVGDRLERQVKAELESLIERVGRPGPVEVQVALRSLLVPGVQLRVYGGDGSLIIGFQRGSAAAPMPMRPPMDQRPGSPVGIPPQIDSERLASLTEIRGPAGRPILYFSVQNEGFLMDESNRILFLSVVRALLIGLATAALLSILGAYGLSRRLSRTTSAISTALSEVAAGRREVRVERGTVTELNQIASDTEHLQEVLQREEHLRAQWAQDVAHDLRTPLTALRAQLEAVRDGVLSDDGTRVEKMLTQLVQVEHLVENLSELSRLESPDTRIERTLIEVPRIARDLALIANSQLESQAPGSEVKVDALSGVVRADRDLLVRACMNLVDNAVRYRTPGTIIRVGIAVAGNNLVFTVRNSGSLPEDSDRLFERLARGEQSRGLPGSGLGLPIVRAIAERHEGSSVLLQVDATTVEARIELPLAD